MKRAPMLLMLLLVMLVTINCFEQSGGQVVSAEIKDININKDLTLLWLEVADQYTMRFPLKMVHLVYDSQVKIMSPYATLRFNRGTDAYEVDIKMPTLQDLQSWEQAFDKNEPVVLYPKP